MFFKAQSRLLLAVLLGAVAVLLPACGKAPVPMNPKVALITDFGWGDPYVAQLKGAILSTNARVELIDITHDLPKFGIQQASYFTDRAARYFPAGTIFVVVVDPGVGTDRKTVVLKTKAGKYYVGPDNGIFTQVIKREEVEEAHELTNPAYHLRPDAAVTFHGRDVFGPAAAHLAAGTDLKEFGPKLASLTMLNENPATVVGNNLTGEVVYVDHYGNIVTNFRADHLAGAAYGTLLKATLNGRSLSLPYLKTYGDAPDIRPFALIGSDGELEIAVAKGSAAEQLKAAPGQKITLRK
jgi:S-adenosylmethionine hydrolase